MVIEKVYNNYSELATAISIERPNWINLNTQATIQGKTSNEYYVGTENTNASVLVYNSSYDPNGVSGCPALAIAAKNSETNLNNKTEAFGSSSSNHSTKTSNGLVRIISTDHAFGVVLMDSDRIIKTGAAIAYKGALNDHQYWAFIGNDTTNTTSSFFIAQGILDTVNQLRTTTTNYVNNYILTPYCDWQHGYTEPVDDVYISYTVGSSGMPDILKDIDGNAYYRVTSYAGANYPTIYIKSKAE